MGILNVTPDSFSDGGRFNQLDDASEKMIQEIQFGVQYVSFCTETMESYDEFNKAEVDAYRGVLDDIAKELGHRVHKTEVMGEDGGPVKVEMIALGGIDPDEDI